MVALKKFRHVAPSFSDLLPYAALVDNGIVLLKDGGLMAGWYFAGPDSESSTAFERNEVSRQINSVLARLGNGWMIQMEAVRIPSTGYPAKESSHFPDPITALIDDERRQRFEAGEGHFESQHALILTYRPPEKNKSKLVKYIYSDEASRNTSFASRTLEHFKTTIREFEQYMANVVSIRRMETHEIPDGQAGRERHSRYDDLLQFARFALIGENHPIRLPDIAMYLDHLVTAEFHHGLTPIIDDRYVGVVSIDGFPAESWPGILNALDLMPITYRWSSRFIFLDPVEARSVLEKTRKKWLQKVRPLMDQLFKTNSGSLDQDAMVMVGETEDAIAEANSQLVAFGHYTPVIVLFDTNQTQLQEKCEAVRRLVQNEGFGGRVETLNTTEAFLGSLPGVSYANVREPLVSTRNLADLAPLNSVWAGSPEAPCPFYPVGSPPLMQVASGSSPFRFNLHVGDLGHTLIFGPTGSGKSTLLALIAAQFRRYENAQVFVFDKGKSMYPLTLAVGADHYDIGKSDTLAFAPLSSLEDDTDKAFAAEWLETLIQMQGVKVLPEHRNAITTQIELMSKSQRRSLTDFVSGVQNRDIKDALQYYTVEGPMGSLLDAETDGLSLSSFQTFEIEELMNMGDRNLIPVLLYLFRRIEKRLTGSPSLLILDEAWLMLSHPVFRDKIREWLKVLRKANCAVVLATQSISDAERSGIIDVLKESCPTKVCLPNGEARVSGTRDFYERLGFNDQQIEIIASAIPKRDYYVTSPDGRRLFDMALGPITLSFVGASGKDDIKRIDDLHHQHGDTWPIEWLKQRGIDNADQLLG
ncbi:VirB4 family type IV secretion/conjugal transfer ATPase [Labrenzia sp. R4_2]|uniref:conjugal transfer protein TrbE n=1 Tax=Labrenzia sp. R4_2 TaxID=2821107 RepID=UPI001ADBB0C1|nr:conjugal transfer protein TrbE [Labrenzia sp. R4_2]MBO9422795.1 VirB4 family type IV secretion/conjugal transfer ATPase [Labrenzia sp. R4_2]